MTTRNGTLVWEQPHWEIRHNDARRQCYTVWHEDTKHKWGTEKFKDTEDGALDYIMKQKLIGR